MKDMGNVGFSIMTRFIFSASGRLLLPVLSVICVTFFSSAVYAGQVVAGCDEAIWKALDAKAQAQVAYDVAVTREIIDKPESVLKLTCFKDAAGVSAKKGGAVFSGDFRDDLSNVMPIGNGNNFVCGEIQRLWDDVIVKQGINAKVPYATFDDLLNGQSGSAPAGAGDQYQSGWDAAADALVFDKLRIAVQDMPTPPTPPLDFSQEKTACNVLEKAKIYQGPCPPPP